MDASPKVRNIEEAGDWFQVLHTGRQSQTAVMTLEPGRSSGPEPEAHEKSEQVLLVMEGEVHAEIEGRHQTLRRGDAVLIPPGVKHKFSNQAANKAVTFNTYSPPEY